MADVAELIFFTGPMDCGKSTLALQVAYTETSAGRQGRLFTRLDRAGGATISSRIGLDAPALEVDDELDFWRYVVTELTSGNRIDYLVCDESQFYRSEHIDQLARIVDELQIDVFCFGILTDFRTQLFPASRRLVELCDRMEILQVRPRCWCGEPATHNARTVDGVMVTEGSQVVVGDTDAGQISYQVLCRRHHRRRLTRQIAAVTLNPEPLPFERS
jgi:thymidine kinase